MPQGRLGLETIRALLDRLGNPHRRLPPTFHVAGTNGKGSTCAFLRAMLEAEGYAVHVTTSPHLVRYNERIRLAGKLIDDAALASLLAEVLDASERGGEDLAPSFFEVTIAAAFLAFSRTPADACVVEVGLGGRFDATNVLEPDVLAACGIAALGIDHERFLLAPEEGVPKQPLARIAFEKAGIAKPGIPLVALGARNHPLAREAIADVAQRVGAELVALPDDSEEAIAGIAPSLAGEHQRTNAALAVAMLQAQDKLPVSNEPMAAGIASTRWPARMQRLGPGPLTRGIDAPVILDGAHNSQSAEALAAALGDGPLIMIAGILRNRNPQGIFEHFRGRVTRFCGVPVPGHEHNEPRDMCMAAIDMFGLPGAYPADGVAPAMDWLRDKPPAKGERILIVGSLYLAGEVLRLNDQVPD